jgi:limonene-1,2-epoxide hydrolase
MSTSIHQTISTRRHLALRSLAPVCFLLTVGMATIGQSATMQNSGKDRASILLDLKKSRADYEVARQQLENDTRLYEEKAISSNEYTKSKNALLSREVDYQKLILQLISQQSYVIIERAVKYQTAGGERRVKITLKSTLEGNEEYLSQFKEHFDVFTPEMRAGKVYNIFVSLSDITDHTIIGSPYEYQIPAIEIGQEASADFELLKDAENLSVSLSYNGQTSEKNIYLKQDASINVIDISSMQFSQEADLNSSVTYALTLERFSTSDDVYRLMVTGLPQQITCEFLDETSKISQIKFAQGVNTKKLSLRLFLPDRDDERIRIDQPLKFHVLTLTGEQYNQIASKDLTAFTSEQLTALSCGREMLELVPRGKGKIEVRATNLYHEISTGDSVTMNLTVRNAGTRRLDNVKISGDSPIGWKTVITPDLIRTLEPEKEISVHIAILPPENSGVGAQEVKIKTEALADNRKVDTEDKTIRIQMNAKTSVFGTVILLLLLVGVVGGLVWFGIKLSRR